MSENVNYRMYLDAFGRIRAYEPVDGNRYALITEMYYGNYRNNRYVLNDVLTAEMKAGDEGRLEEVFGTGTAAVVSPVKELDWKEDKVFINDGKIGPVTQKLYDTMTGMQWGKIPDTKGWIVPVCKG